MIHDDELKENVKQGRQSCFLAQIQSSVTSRDISNLQRITKECRQSAVKEFSDRKQKITQLKIHSQSCFSCIYFFEKKLLRILHFLQHT